MRFRSRKSIWIIVPTILGEELTPKVNVPRPCEAAPKANLFLLVTNLIDELRRRTTDARRQPEDFCQI